SAARKFKNCKSDCTNCGGIFDLPGKELRLEELNARAEDPEIWKDAQASANLEKERSRLQKQTDLFKQIHKRIDDANELLELAAEDEEIASELDQGLSEADTAMEKLELERMLSGPHDNNDAIVSINAGAGGTESQDWAQMVQRMLMRW